MSTVIAGGGIAGLTAALALHRHGVTATVLEQRATLDTSERPELVWSNGMDALDRLGVGEAVRAHGRPLEVEEWRSWKGDLLYEVPVGELARTAGRSDPIVIRRSDLIAILAGELTADVVRTSMSVIAADQDSDGLIVRLTGGGEVRGDFLLGADGPRSRVRTGVLDGPYGATVSGTWLYGVAQPPTAPAEGRTIIALGRGNRCLVRDLGGGWVGWSAVVHAPPGVAMPTRDAFLKRFHAFPESIRTALVATSWDTVHRDDVRVVPVQPAPDRPRTALLGDAAHAFPPSLARGAGEAIVDGSTFADVFVRHGPEAAGASFHAARSAATSAVHAEALRLDRIFGWRSAPRVAMREQAMKRVISRKASGRVAAELREELG